ncbi:MAG: metallopeptidase family protein [Meiothermus sp.]|uniref:metallopeptidase family protein n=1 Tax=Meiothermus sp. TaxID=1955249 RepID=UPI0028CC913B|nr:metallopeptidase family protein [Meiothermus sp.]MDT7920639.1 metallopeptidase family protein [Meiothermus sp.]
MTYEAFVETAARLWDEIPSEYKRGLQGVHVLEQLKTDPDEPQLLRLGEYYDPGYPSVLGGFAGIGRHIILFYGSFAALAAADSEFDWEGEIWETLVHELRHHLESLAGRDDLVQEDMENLRRYREGR